MDMKARQRVKHLMTILTALDKKKRLRFFIVVGFLLQAQRTAPQVGHPHSVEFKRRSEDGLAS